MLYFYFPTKNCRYQTSDGFFSFTGWFALLQCPILLNNKKVHWSRRDCIGSVIVINFATASIKTVKRGVKVFFKYEIFFVGWKPRSVSLNSIYTNNTQGKYLLVGNSNKCQTLTTVFTLQLAKCILRTSILKSNVVNNNYCNKEEKLCVVTFFAILGALHL